jgi:hypothetical protein
MRLLAVPGQYADRDVPGHPGSTVCASSWLCSTLRFTVHRSMWGGCLDAQQIEALNDPTPSMRPARPVDVSANHIIKLSGIPQELCFAKNLCVLVHSVSISMYWCRLLRIRARLVPISIVIVRISAYWFRLVSH